LDRHETDERKELTLAVAGTDGWGMALGFGETPLG
jgi:hypothetical protein